MPLPQPPQGTAGPAAGGKLAAKVGGPKNLALLGAAGTVALVGLIAMRKNSSASTTTAATDPTADPSTYDSSTYDAWNQWQTQYEDLQQQISSIQAGQTTATGPGTPTPAPTTPLTPSPLPWPVPVTRPPVPTPAPGGSVPRPTPKAKTSTYVVKKGDTLSGIAKKSGISMATLKKLNPVYWTNKKYQNGNKIWSGDKVVI